MYLSLLSAGLLTLEAEIFSIVHVNRVALHIALYDHSPTHRPDINRH